MFTGIISHFGKITNKKNNRIKIQPEKEVLKHLSNGTSIAVNGICFTVLNTTDIDFEVDFMPETEERTNVKYLKIEDLVNLELPATPTTFLSGSIIQGHIDTTAKLKKVEERGNSKILYFAIPVSFSKYIVEKGAIAVNGISLTVISAGSDYFTIGIIPFTWEKTNLKNLRIGDYVNIEVDIIGKYLEKLLEERE